MEIRAQFSYEYYYPDSNNQSYEEWLELRSMLHQASEVSELISGMPLQWKNSFGVPQTDEVIEKTSFFLYPYPISTITRNKQTYLNLFAEQAIWKSLKAIGFDGLYMAPIQRAGGIDGFTYTSSVDLWQDPISFDIDPLFGDEFSFIDVTLQSKMNQSVVVSSIIASATGLGADFILALRHYKNYPGLYLIVEIPEEYWGLLPFVSRAQTSLPIAVGNVNVLMQKGILPGEAQAIQSTGSSIFQNDRVVSPWEAVGPQVGHDFKTRRWAYFRGNHPNEPLLNWSDPSCSANRIVFGNIIQNVIKRGAIGVSLRGNEHLDLTYDDEDEVPSQVEDGNAVSLTAMDLLAQMIRKVGGWSLQSSEVSLDWIQKSTEKGPDLTVDFMSHTALIHALLTQDASFLRLTLDLMSEYKLSPKLFVRILQTENGFSNQLSEFLRYPQKNYTYLGKSISGKALRQTIIQEIQNAATGTAFPYNVAMQNAICTTTVGLIAASMQLSDIQNLSASQKKEIQKRHLLLCFFNAMQPGAVALSSWDLVGALPLEQEVVRNLTQNGDFRWAARGAVDLFGVNVNRETSSFGIPTAKTAYNNLSQQLKQSDSFAAILLKMGKQRKGYKLPLAERIDLPLTKSLSALILVHQLPSGEIQISAMNFSEKSVEEVVILKDIANLKAYDMLEEKELEQASAAGEYTIKLAPYGYQALVFKKPSST